MKTGSFYERKCSYMCDYRGSNDFHKLLLLSIKTAWSKYLIQFMGFSRQVYWGFAVPSSSGSCFVRTLHYDSSILGAPAWHDSELHWVMQVLLTWQGSEGEAKRAKKRATEDEMVEWHHRCNGHELGQLQEMVRDRKAWHAAVHWVTKSWAWVDVWTTSVLELKELL